MLSLQAVVLLAASVAGDTALIDFTAPWCGPCRQMEPAVQRLTALGYPVRKVNIDQEPSLAAQFKVSSIPCFVLVVDGREVDRSVGGTSFERLQEMLSRHAVPKGTDVNQARGQSPDASATRRAAPARSAHTDDAQLRSRLLAASVRLKIIDPNGHSFGSGTIIDASGSDALILTCGHIFRDSQGKGQINVDLFGPGAPQGVPGRLVGYDLKSDVGLVSFRPGCKVQAVEVATANYQVRRGDKVVNIGCNNGGEPTLRASHVASLDKFLGPPNVQVAGQPVQGRSGGGLFTADGRVIGVCNAADPADDEGLYAALPSIWAQLERHAGSRLASRSQTAAPAERRAAQVAELPGSKLPAMPERMPASMAQQPLTARSQPRTIGNQERAALAEIASRDPSAEVICIVRSPGNRSESEIIVLDKASQEFLSKLAAERSLQGVPDSKLPQQQMLADTRLPSGGKSSQPRPVAVSPDLVKPATHARSPANTWKPQWLKPN